MQEQNMDIASFNWRTEDTLMKYIHVRWRLDSCHWLPAWPAPQTDQTWLLYQKNSVKNIVTIVHYAEGNTETHHTSGTSNKYSKTRNCTGYRNHRKWLSPQCTWRVL